MSEMRFDELSDGDLEGELARRRAKRLGKNALQAEIAVELSSRELKRRSLELWFLEESAKEGSGGKPCPRCKKIIGVRGKDRERRLQSISGEVRYRRHYHYCRSCSFGFYPLDDRLGVSGDGEVTPELERRLLDFGVNEPFAQAAERVCVHYGLTVSPTLLQRVIHRAGDLLRGAEQTVLQQRLRSADREHPELLVVQTDGSMLPTRGDDAWREVKLGTVTRQAREDGELCIRTSFAAHLGSVDAFGEDLSAVLRAEQLEQAQRVVWVGDGAPWVWNLAQQLAPHAIQVLDYYHATLHAHDCAKRLFGEKSPWISLWIKRVEQLLLTATPRTLIKELKMTLLVAPQGKPKEALRKLIAYYCTNEQRMYYAHYKSLDLPIGSGTVEAAHKHVLQIRMKRAGQRWNTDNADAMAALRALYCTVRPEGFYFALKTAATLHQAA